MYLRTVVMDRQALPGMPDLLIQNATQEHMTMKVEGT